MYHLVRDASRLGEIANEIAQAPAIGLDTETTSLSPHHGKVRLLQINTGKNIWLIDLFHTKTLGPIAEALRGGAVKVGQNLKFDQKFLLHGWGIELWPVFDTYRASAIMHGGKEGVSHTLGNIYAREIPGVAHKGELGGSDWNGELSQDQLEYASEDVEHLLLLRDVMKPKLSQDGFNKAALIEFQVILPEASIELNGFHLDPDIWLRLFEENKVLRDRLKEELFRELPHPKGLTSLPGMTVGWNLGSWQQKQASLRLLGLNVSSTQADTLAMHVAEFPVLRKMIEYSKVSKLCTAFGPDYLKHVDPVTGRIHTHFYGFLATARYSSSDPNLQQIPRQTRYREAFTAPAGRMIVTADFSQIELRMMAQLSKDRLLMEVYRKGLDAHRQTAALVNEVALEEVTKVMRQGAKPVNFGLIFGMGAARLVEYAMSAYGVVMSLKEAERFREKFFQGYAGVKKWHYETLSNGKRTGVSRTMSGRIRYLGEETYSEHLNTPVQGSCADGLKASLPIVYRKLKKYGGSAKLVHMVHDEIEIESGDDPEELESIKQDLVDGMTEGMQQFLPDVPVVVDAAYGKSWAEH